MTARPGGSHRTVLWGVRVSKRDHIHVWISQNSDQAGGEYTVKEK